MSDRIDVSSGRGTYPVVIGAGALTELPRWLAARKPAQVAIVSTRPVWRAQGERFAQLTRRDGAPILMPDGERSKTLETVEGIYRAFSRRALDRAAIVVAIGGGVVGDVAGFAAASYLRGLTLVQVPTTLLAQVDSAVGGKVGVNLSTGKNLVGAFYPPSLVVCDPVVLESLNAREFRGGLYEVVKYGVIASPALFARISDDLDAIVRRNRRKLGPVVAECCRIKADVVSRDERESGPRRILNFGHTIGHALEAVTQYRRFRHGEAVAYGMLAAARISAARGLMPDVDEVRLRALVERLGRLPGVRDLSIRRALEAIAHDKKVVAGRLHFVLARSIGATVVVDDVTTDELVAAMTDLGMAR